MNNGFLCIHFPTDDTNKEIFEFKLQENDIRVVEWDKLKETEKK